MNASQLAQQLLSGQVGAPFDMGGHPAVGYPGVGYPGYAYPAAVGYAGYGFPQVGDLVNVAPVYPGQVRPGVAGPAVNPYYVGVPAIAEAAAPANQQVQYSPPQYVAGDVTYLGFASTVITAGSLGTTVNVTTQRPFTPQKMGCPSTTIGLLITQINISGTNLLSNSLGIPVELFSEVSTFPQILWPTLDTATGVQFIVANPTAGNLTFSGAFYGTQVRR